jgi:hypothetical protein
MKRRRKGLTQGQWVGLAGVTGALLYLGARAVGQAAAEARAREALANLARDMPGGDVRVQGLRGFGQLRAGAFRGQVGQVVHLGGLGAMPLIVPTAPPVPSSLPRYSNSMPQFEIDAPAQIRRGRMTSTAVGRGRALEVWYRG